MIATHQFAHTEQLSSEPELLRALMRAIPDPLILVDANGRLTPLNHAGEQVAAAAGRGHTDARDRIEAAASLARNGSAGDPVPIGLDIDGAALCYEVTARKVGDDVLITCRDVSAETSVREVLLESRQRYKHLVEIGADFIWECDETGAFSFVSEPGAFGYPPHRIVGRQPRQFISSGDGAWPNRVTAAVRNWHVAVRAADGGELRLSLDAGPIQDDHCDRVGVRGVARALADDTALVRADAREARGDANTITGIVQAMHAEWRPDDMLHNCAAGVWHGFGAAGCVILGASEGEEWQTLAEAGDLPPDSHIATCRGMLRDRRTLRPPADAAGKAIAVALHCQGKRNGVLFAWRPPERPDWQDSDVSMLSRLDAPCGLAVQQALQIRRLTRLSRSDSLTGLLNRRAFLTELTAGLARANRQRTTGALLYLDLDHFKRLNDHCGHEIGNAALTDVATILTSAIRPYDLAARLGGDEFVLWLEDISGRDAGRCARRITAAIAEWSSRQTRREMELGASIGIAMFDPKFPESPDDLIGRADRAMYRAKRTAGSHVMIARRRRTKTSSPR